MCACLQEVEEYQEGKSMTAALSELTFECSCVLWGGCVIFLDTDADISNCACSAFSFLLQGRNLCCTNYELFFVKIFNERMIV